MARVVEVRLFPFGQLRRRSALAFEKLSRRIAVLVQTIGPLSYDRQFVAGGALTRALLSVDGWEDSDHDLDLFVVAPNGASEIAGMLEAAGAAVAGDGSSSGDRFKFVFGEAGSVDIVQATAPAAQTIARFDLRASALATDGQTILAVRGAMFDLRNRHAFPLRETRADRVKRYVRGHRLDVSPGAPELDVDRIVDGIPGWTLPPDSPWDVIMGRAEEVIVRSPVEDVSLVTGRN